MYVWEWESESCMMANCILKGPKELSQKTFDTSLGVKSNCHVIHEMIEAMDGVMARWQTFLAKKKSLLLLSVYLFTIFNYSFDILKISKDLLFHARLKLQEI